MAVPSEAAARRFQTVWNDYEAWLFENPSRNPEEYLADLLKRGRSATWTVNERYVLGRSDPEATAPIEAQSIDFLVSRCSFSGARHSKV